MQKIYRSIYSILVSNLYLDLYHSIDLDFPFLPDPNAESALSISIIDVHISNKPKFHVNYILLITFDRALWDYTYNTVYKKEEANE